MVDVLVVENIFLQSPHIFFIVYTTQSHLVVTPLDGQTSLLILKNEPKHFCLPPDSTGIPTATLLQAVCIISHRHNFTNTYRFY